MIPQPPNSGSDDFQIYHTGIFLGMLSGVPDIEGATLNFPSVYQGHSE